VISYNIPSARLVTWRDKLLKQRLSHFIPVGHYSPARVEAIINFYSKIFVRDVIIEPQK